MKSARFIGVAGGSCSGKTLFARRLGDALAMRARGGGGDERTGDGGLDSAAAGCAIVSIDSYYFGLADAAPEAIERYNFDDPAALDHELLADHLSRLASGHAADVPVYDFSTHTRAGDVRRIEPAGFVIVEGLFSLYWDDVRAALDIKVIIDLPHDECLARRIERDTWERGRPREEIIRRYETMARPMYDEYVLPSRSHADVVVDGKRPVVESIETVLRVVDEGPR